MCTRDAVKIGPLDKRCLKSRLDKTETKPKRCLCTGTHIAALEQCAK